MRTRHVRPILVDTRQYQEMLFVDRIFSVCFMELITESHMLNKVADSQTWYSERNEVML